MDFGTDYDNGYGPVCKQAMQLDHGWELWYVRGNDRCPSYQLRRDHVIVPVSREYVSKLIDKMVPEV